MTLIAASGKAPVGDRCWRRPGRCGAPFSSQVSVAVSLDAQTTGQYFERNGSIVCVAAQFMKLPLHNPNPNRYCKAVQETG